MALPVHADLHSPIFTILPNSTEYGCCSDHEGAGDSVTMGTPHQDRHLCCSTNTLALHTTTWRSRLVVHAGICLFPDGVFKGLLAGCLMPNVLLEVSISTHPAVVTLEVCQKTLDW